MSAQSYDAEHAVAPTQSVEPQPSPIQMLARQAEAARQQSAHVVQRMGRASPVQRAGGGATEAVHRAAAHGVQGSGGSLPHRQAIQKSFGKHDVSGVQAHVGGKAAEASDAMGANAYATGNAVAFKEAPDLHTAAHEAAHIVQQRGGVQLKGGVGQVGDRYEQHADAVADRVVQGESAEGLLDQYAGSGPGGGVQQRAVQLDYRNRTDPTQVISDEEHLRRFGMGPYQENHPWEYIPPGGTPDGGPTNAATPQTGPNQSTETPLSDAQRNALHTQLSSRLGTAYTKYSNACQEALAGIRAEQAARVELVMTLVSVGFVFATPALGRSIAALANRVPASASVTTHRVALGMMNQAQNIASSMAELGKAAAKAGVQRALANSSNAQAYFSALDQGFSLTVDQIVGHVAANITSRTALPDARLWLYVSQWDPANITKDRYKQQLRQSYRAFQRQVQPIGDDWLPEIRGTTNLGRTGRNQWHLYEEYAPGRYLQKAQVQSTMLEAAANRSVAEFGAPWQMTSIGEQMISGGEMAEMFRRSGNAPAPRGQQQGTR